MNNREKLQEYFNSKYYNKDNNYKAILSEIRVQETMNKKNFLKMISTIIITLLGTTGIVFASTKIYNDYIKKQDSIDSYELFATDEGLISNDFTEDMIYEENLDLYYKIINNIEDYNKYKTKITKLPDMVEENFNDNFLVLIGNFGSRNPHESDLTISEINADENTMYVTLKPRENPNYDKNSITLYAVVERNLLRKNVKINFDFDNINNPNFTSLDNLPNNYSIEEALRDGCFVEEEKKILSENKYAIDEMIEKSKNDENCFVRIYSKSPHRVRIIDLEYKNGIFIGNAIILGEKGIDTFSFKYLTKRYYAPYNTYDYGYNNIDRSIDAGLLLTVYLD